MTREPHVYQPRDPESKLETSKKKEIKKKDLKIFLELCLFVFVVIVLFFFAQLIQAIFYWYLFMDYPNDQINKML